MSLNLETPVEIHAFVPKEAKRMYQSITIIGRLGRDPEMRYLPNGDPVTSFSVATDRGWTDKNGQKQKETTWFRVSVFGKQAENTNTYLSKGKMVLVEGRLSVDTKQGGAARLHPAGRGDRSGLRDRG